MNGDYNKRDKISIYDKTIYVIKLLPHNIA